MQLSWQLYCLGFERAARGEYSAKHSFGDKCVPKCNFGTRGNE